MKLVVFDIDGTLTETSRIDEVCFQRTYAELLELQDILSALETCAHVSDTGLTRHIYQTSFGRAPAAHEEAAICERVVHWLQEHHRLDPSHFVEVAGAERMLAQLAEKQDWVIAVATGCWRASAEMKLRAARLWLHEKPGGFAEDGPARESIVGSAIARAKAHYGYADFEKIVSVGDGVWDVKTAANLGVSFVGIAREGRAEALRQQGARHIVPDYSDADSFFACLGEALIPQQSLQKAV
jgi:phosphoglycolate phosphatase-like HAD superfamily hydrolase